MTHAFEHHEEAFNGLKKDFEELGEVAREVRTKAFGVIEAFHTDLIHTKIVPELEKSLECKLTYNRERTSRKSIGKTTYVYTSLGNCVVFVRFEGFHIVRVDGQKNGKPIKHMWDVACLNQKKLPVWRTWHRIKMKIEHLVRALELVETGMLLLK